MLNTLRASTLVLLLSLIVSGCSFAPDLSAKKEKDATSASEGTEAANSEEIEGAQAATEYKEQPWFEKRRTTTNKAPRAMSGGLWVYNLNSYPGYLGKLVNFEEVDVLHIQLTDKEYYGHILDPLAIEFLNDTTVRVVLSLKKDREGYDFQVEAKKNEPARVFIKVEKGKLQGKKFIIETDTGEKLSIN
ncbi:hypothetical protein IC620_12205 [Hazenella sp. IB182357]|uniref:Lipoprotein n=1 Tax=Polycladospora coralii TaxID=2771432 RepID=A0A926NAT4_9BACL|nr:hypothetical protein [Polycladospora coralii]MBD1373117.1 hypothetical protein [Polycladospora coralii]